MMTTSTMKVRCAVLTRSLALVLLVAGSLALGAGLHRRDGRLRAVRGLRRMDADELGTGLGRVATLVQFSSETCVPCRAARRVLAGLAAARPDDVVHVDLDAVAHLDLARRHHVLATPTVLLLDAGGTVRWRSSGAVDPAALRRALDEQVLAPTLTQEVSHG